MNNNEKTGSSEYVKPGIVVYVKKEISTIKGWIEETFGTKVTAIENEVTELKDNIRIDHADRESIRRQGNARVTEILGGKDSVAYREIGRKMFPKLWSEYKRKFKIPSYGDLRKVDKAEAERFISIWNPDTETLMNIEDLNNQITIS